MNRRTFGRASWPIYAGLIGLLWLITWLYGRSVGFGLFWDDPLWFGRVVGRSVGELIRPNPTFQFYRPGVLLYNRLFLRADNTLNAPLLHLWQIAWHWLDICLVYALSRRLGFLRSPALAVSALFALNPFWQQAVAWAAPQQPLALCLQNGAWLAYLLAFRHLASARPSGGSWRWLAVSYTLYFLALTVQESAIPLGLLPLLFGWLLWPAQRRVWLPAALGYLGLAAAAGLVWLWVPRLGGVVGLYTQPSVLAYLLQGLTYPAWGNVWGYSAEWSAPVGLISALSLALLGALLILARRLRQARRAALGLAWACLGLLPFAVGLNYEYMSLAARALTYAAPGIAWLCVCVLWGLPRPPRLLLLALILGQSAVLAAQQQTLFVQGAGHLRAMVTAMDAETAAGRSRLLFVNAPDRFRWRRPLYPVGYWGLPLAPVAVDLGDYAALAVGRRPQTLSYALPWIDQAARQAGPYAIDLRGVIVSASELVQAARGVDAVYLSRYAVTGAWRLERAGRLLLPDGVACGVAWFGTAACLDAAQVHRQGQRVTVTLVWRGGDSAESHDTIFLHYGLPGHPPLTQADGNAWRDMLPMTDWPPDARIEDERTLDLPPGDDSPLTVGVYNWVTGERLPIYTPDGAPWPTELVQLNLPPAP